MISIDYDSYYDIILVSWYWLRLLLWYNIDIMISAKTPTLSWTSCREKKEGNRKVFIDIDYDSNYDIKIIWYADKGKEAKL